MEPNGLQDTLNTLVTTLRVTLRTELSSIWLPIQFGVIALVALGLWENLLQAVLQGLLAGPGAIYLFTRSVVLLGAGRAAVFPTLVPPGVLLIGWIALGSMPSVLQLIGLAIVLIGFRLTQRA